MSAIKKFFEKGKLELKFKKAGEGRKLNDPSSSQLTKDPEKHKQNESRSSQEISDVRKKVAEANLARVTQAKESRGSSKHRSYIKAEILAEKKEMNEALAQSERLLRNPTGVTVEASSVISGVYFKCPLLGSDEALPRPQMERRVEEFLISQLPEEPQLTSILMINMLNKDKNSIKACRDILTKYLTNIVDNPSNENYRRIKLTNKVLNEKVLSCKGGSEFLQSIGFERKKLAVDGNAEEEYYILDTNGVEEEEFLEKLRDLLASLKDSTPMELELHRDLKVFSPSQKDATKFQVPNDFYVLTAKDVKREQKHLEESVNKMERLMTKEMREREKQRDARRYHYAAIRIKFPDGFMIQGTFAANETFASIREFVLDCIEHDFIPFHLSSSMGQRITDENKTISELDLAPASLLQFSFDQNILKEAIQQDEKMGMNVFLKKDLKMLAIEV